MAETKPPRVRKPTPTSIEEAVKRAARSNPGAFATAPKPPAPRYAPGSHAGAVRADHDAKRIALIARQDVLSAERDRIDAEMKDINEALGLLSKPAEPVRFKALATAGESLITTGQLVPMGQAAE